MSATEPDVEKCREKIMAEYLALGIAGRWKYHEKAKEYDHQQWLRRQHQPQQKQQEGEEEEQEQSASFTSTGPSIPDLRHPAEWRCARLLKRQCLHVWVRTSYSSEDNFLSTLDEEEIERATNAIHCSVPDDLPVVIDVAELYEGLNLDQIVNRLPELAESSQRDPTYFQEHIQGALEDMAEGLNALEEDLAEENCDLDSEDVEIYRDQILLEDQTAWVTGCFWVQDVRADKDIRCV